ncbi:MAG: HAD-IC family P-type ATPase, partial [Clostridiales bacterium]|nr:HAD-IC family P-type ATPase [Clostridiales bacterium]
MSNDVKSAQQGGCPYGCEVEAHGEKTGKRELAEMVSGAILFASGLVLHFAFGVRDIITLPVFIAAYLILGLEILIGAAKGLIKKHVFGEDFLMSIASLGAFAIGSFEEAVGVMLFYRVGEWFEHRAAGSARRSVTSLLSIRPDRANLLLDGEITVVAPADIEVGSLILIKPGERIPLDGAVTDGVSALDTSALTGESLPRDVAPGDKVLSGCVNTSGVLTVRVDKPFGESTVEKILELVESSAAKKAPAEKFITKFARIYTPAVVILAVLIAVFPPLLGLGEFTVWLKKALTLLVISCPCALVLSIPLAFFSGIGAASRRGILIKGGNYLDALQNLGTVALDKTGTLTRGVFEVSEISPADGISKSELLELAAHAEMYSTHPIAHSILREYGVSPDPDRISGYGEIAGNGVRADIDGRRVLAGNAQFFL